MHETAVDLGHFPALKSHGEGAVVPLGHWCDLPLALGAKLLLLGPALLGGSWYL